MTWGAIGGAAIGLVGNSLLSDGGGGSQQNGGAGTQTASKEPWAAAAPWIKSNLASGQALQAQYAAQPFNQQQLGAYANLGKQTGYMNQLVPSLLGQIGAQRPGFDLNNQSARPQAYSFDGVRQAQPAAALLGDGGQPNGSQGMGLLSMLGGDPSAGATSAANPAPQAPAPQPASTFQQQDASLGHPFGLSSFVMEDLARTNPGNWMQLMQGQPGGAAAGGYGEFKYGQAMPAPGSKAYRDMSEYFANGGADPANIYGRATAKQDVIPSWNLF